jgi:hypothetical protein
MCVGNQLASRQLYTMLLRLIWAFKIELSTNPAENKWGIDPLQVRIWCKIHSAIILLLTTTTL